MARKKQKQQTRLTFEPVAPSSSSKSPNRASPAKIRYARGAGAGVVAGPSTSPSRASPSHTGIPTRTSGRLSKKQSKLSNSKPRLQNASSPTKRPTASFMPRLHTSQRIPASGDSSDDEYATAVEDEEESGKEGDDVPFKSSQSVSTKLQNTVLDDDDDDIEDEEDDDEDDEPIAPPSTIKRRRPAAITLEDDDEDDDEDEDDQPIIPPSSVKRRRPQFVELEDSSDDGTSPAKKRKIATPGRLRRPGGVGSSSPIKHGGQKGHRSEKQKKMELLRRRRAGEKIEKLTSSEDDSDDEEKRGIYDTDPEEEFEVLKDFDDEDPEEDAAEEEAEAPASRQRKEKKVAKGDDGEGEDEDDLGGFVTDDDDAPLGAPANLDIPIEFTAQAHQPLKHQFPHAIEWLVRNRIDPAFTRNDPRYSLAWRKLNDEVRALASSKFASSAWKSDFHRALKGRPKMESYEMDRGERDSGLYDSCEACGRTNHPASFRVTFSGHPYHQDTLADVESESDDSEDDGAEHRSIDSMGLVVPSETRSWYVGAVCCSNAETAHSLIHWKYALKEWVEAQLEADGWMKAAKLEERENMRTKQRRKLADQITDEWREKNIVASLYRDFKNNLEDARNKTTTGHSRWR
ncbi:hypothetical protein M426DRAFT_317578 [Hypoxylon sp. CI-4A]|nr:hypothetical protein M426DRAFT_317578 [Hypoxylon sp. CI-4A]